MEALKNHRKAVIAQLKVNHAVKYEMKNNDMSPKHLTSI